MKKLIRHNLTSITFNGTIDEVLKYIQDESAYYLEKGYSDLKIDYESVYEGGYDHYLYGYKMETDIEEQNREESEARWAKSVEDQQRLQYETLKAKFEPQ